MRAPGPFWLAVAGGLVLLGCAFHEYVYYTSHRHASGPALTLIAISVAGAAVAFAVAWSMAGAVSEHYEAERWRKLRDGE